MYGWGGKEGSSHGGGHDIQSGEESRMYTDVTKSSALMV